MDETEFQNSSLNTPEHNSVGDEFNRDALLEKDSSVGGKDLNYSYSSKRTKVASHSFIPTTAVAATSVAGVVIASILIFSSALGNMFSVKEDSLNLLISYSQDSNIAFLDYSFDLLYDRSGSVYVKLMSTSDSYTSEKYLITYDGQESMEVNPTSYNESTNTKTRDIHVENISGFFSNIDTENTYNFIVTNVIEGIETEIYRRSVSFASAYGDVVESGYEVYQNQDNSLSVSYNFQVEYEVASSAYVELCIPDVDGGETLSQTSEIYTLVEDERYSTGEGKYSNLISGEFSNLTANSPYILNLISEIEGISKVIYSEYFNAVFEPGTTFAVTEYYAEIYVSDGGAITAGIGVTFEEMQDGYVYLILESDNGSYHYTSDPITPDSATSDGIYAYYEFVLEDVTCDYTFKVMSVVEKEVLVFTGPVETSVQFGSISDFSVEWSLVATSTPAPQVLYTFNSDLDGTSYYTIEDSEGTLLYTSPSSEIYANEPTDIDDDLSESSIAFVYGNEYTFKVYGNWGNKDVLVHEETSLVQA